jgi:hypothetical protein
MGLVNVELADAMPDGWKFWVEWQKVVAPENLTEIRAIEGDSGKLMGHPCRSATPPRCEGG